ncbi:phage baseplate upper protein [Bacillus cereus]|nr:phage baseplate upper protein [Bacillus cereus]
MGTQRYIDMTFDLSYPIEQPKFLQRLGETIPTDIVVQVKNKGVNYNLAGVALGFEMRNDRDKILIDKDQSRFTIVSAAQGIFSYRPPEQMQSFFGNSYLAYFTFESGGTRITTERFRFYNDEDVQLAIAPELQEHYVSVIDDLIESNEGAMAKAEEIKALIQNNQVVKKSGDTMTGNLLMTGASAISQRFKAGTGAQVGWEALTDGTFRMYDWTNNRNVLSYNPATDYVSLNRNNPYVTKTGDTMTGNLNFASASQIQNLASTGQLVFGNSGIWINDTNGNSVPWQYRYSDKMFLVNAETNLMKKTDYTAKDGRATLILPADVATNWDTARAPVALRRGNAVTVKGAIGITASAPTLNATLLPSTMRPPELVTITLSATDNTCHHISIYPGGDVSFPASAKGKNFYFLVTYVVD